MLRLKDMSVLQFLQPLCNKQTFDVINGTVYYLNGMIPCL